MFSDGEDLRRGHGVRIPDQLRGEQFILLGLESKDPYPCRKWSDPKNQYTAEKLESLFPYYPGCNYGVLYKTDLAVLDADDADRLDELGVIDRLPQTFTVTSGRTTSTGLHVYLRISAAPAAAKIILKDPETGDDLGDVRLPVSPFYNVGPGSMHPVSRRPYTVLHDLPIAAISWADFAAVLAPVSWSLKEPQKKRIDAHPAARGTAWGDEYRLSVFDFLTPENPRKRDGEIEGVHPVHGSTTGSNLSVKADGSMWYCRRCGSGGGWLDALAVSHGIIDCGEAGTRKFTREEWKEINKVLRRLRPEVYRSLTSKGRRETVHRAALEATYAKKRGY